MPLSTASIKYYAPISEEGGNIDLSAPQTSSVSNNEFPNVTDEQRQNGLVDYRKQFVRNENVDYWESVRVWISSQPLAGDTLKICQTGSLSLLNATVSLETATFVTATRMTFSSSLYQYIMPGDWIYNCTHDTEAATIRLVTYVSTTTGDVTVASAFGTPTSGPMLMALAPATRYLYTAPSSYGDGIVVGQINPNEYTAVWKQRTVPAFIDGFSGDQFTIIYGSGPV